MKMRPTGRSGGGREGVSGERKEAGWWRKWRRRTKRGAERKGASPRPLFPRGNVKEKTEKEIKSLIDVTWKVRRAFRCGLLSQEGLFRKWFGDRKVKVTVWGAKASLTQGGPAKLKRDLSRFVAVVL